MAGLGDPVPLQDRVTSWKYGIVNIIFIIIVIILIIIFFTNSLQTCPFSTSMDAGEWDEMDGGAPMSTWDGMVLMMVIGDDGDDNDGDDADDDGDFI